MLDLDQIKSLHGTVIIKTSFYKEIEDYFMVTPSLDNI